MDLNEPRAFILFKDILCEIKRINTAVVQISTTVNTQANELALFSLPQHGHVFLFEVRRIFGFI